jgi:hypothetical protein
MESTRHVIACVPNRMIARLSKRYWLPRMGGCSLLTRTEGADVRRTFRGNARGFRRRLRSVTLRLSCRVRVMTSVSPEKAGEF